jgi:hypothetical protein
VCEECGKRITTASEGAIVWRRSLNDDERRKPIILCKGEDAGYTTCLNSSFNRHLPWQQLDGALGHLLFNVGVRSVGEHAHMAELSSLEDRIG